MGTFPQSSFPISTPLLYILFKKRRRSYQRSTKVSALGNKSARLDFTKCFKSFRPTIETDFQESCRGRSWLSPPTRSLWIHENMAIQRSFLLVKSMSEKLKMLSLDRAVHAS